MQQRLWRSRKYEAVYLRELADGFEARRVIGEWIGFYNTATGETMARAELDASNWRRADEVAWRRLWEAEIAGLPSHRESRFWLATGLLLPVWDRLPADTCGSGA